jgi:hypothetical protein
MDSNQTFNHAAFAGVRKELTMNLDQVHWTLTLVKSWEFSAIRPGKSSIVSANADGS